MRDQKNVIKEIPKAYQKFKIIVGIMKDEPERYVEERLRDTLAYAGQKQIPRERVHALFQEIYNSTEKRKNKK